MKKKKENKDDDLIRERAIRWWNVIDDDIDQLLFNDTEAEKYRQTKRYLTFKYSDIISGDNYEDLTIEDVVLIYNEVFSNLEL